MQLRRLFFTILMVGSLISVSAQVHLRISSLSRFPVSPLDTAYESSTYDSVLVTVENIGSALLNNDNITINILGNPANGIDILYEDTNALYSIQLGTAVTILTSGYVFHPTHFDDGDNIVVVWPAARLTPHISDSLTFHVYFVSLLAQIQKSDRDPIFIGPNPINDYIILDLPDKNMFKQVRILNLLGSTIYTLSQGQNYISASGWASGLYFIELTDNNGQKITKRLIKN